MKKLSLILAGALLLGGISFAAPVAKKQAPKASTTKQTAKPATKGGAVKGTKGKPAKGPKGTESHPVKKGAPVKKAAK